MRILSLVIKEIKQMIRDRNGFLFAIAFPIILTMVLGFALSNMYTPDSAPARIDAVYFSEDDSPLSKAFLEDFIPDAEQYNLFLTESTLEKGTQDVKSGNTACFIYIKNDGIELTVRKDSIAGMQLELMTNAFAKGFDAYVTVARINPSALSSLANPSEANSHEFIKSVSLTKDKAPRAIDYYAVTMLTLIIMYGATTGASSISDERQQRTLLRIFASPISNIEILVAKVVGLISITCLQTLMVFLFNKFVLKTEWGSNIPAILALLFAAVIMVISIGVASAYIFKESSTASSILNTTIPFLIFLGGGYVKLDLLGVSGWLEKISDLSPVKLLNKTILQIIYGNDLSGFVPTLLICMVVAVLFLTLTAVLSNKEVRA